MFQRMERLIYLLWGLVFFILVEGSYSILYPSGVNYEVVALIAIKSDLHDPCNVMKNWYATSVDPCSWSMVTCFQDGYVSALGLPSLSLSGTLSSRIGNITKLQSVLLQNNNITGPIPDVTGKLEKLQTLDLSDNKLFGEIPNSVGNLKNFNYLRLDNNSLRGLAPNSLAKVESFTLVIVGIPLICGLTSQNNCSVPYPESLPSPPDAVKDGGDADRISRFSSTLMSPYKSCSWKVLDWCRRNRIALGTAQGLAYLHEQCDKPERSDAGLGICLLQPRLLLLVKRLHQEGKLNLMVDKDLENNFDGMELHEIVLAPLVCTHFNPCHRPKMSQVLRMLEGDGLAEKNGSNSSLQGSVRLRDIPITSRSPHVWLRLYKSLNFGLFYRIR